MEPFIELAATAPADLLFAALETLVQERVGAVIFTCSTFDVAAGKARRVHTNMPDVYPVSGLKDILPNVWTSIVLDQRKTFVANRLDEIAQVFPDHELIGTLGCGSVINMPVFLAGHFMGTVNILHEPGFYSPQKVQALKGLRHAAMLAFAAQMIGSAGQTSA